MPKLFQKAVVNGLTQLYGVTANYSDNDGRNTASDASKRRLAAAAAASVLGASIDKLGGSSPGLIREGGGGANYSDNTSDGDPEMDPFWKDEDWEGSSRSEQENRDKRRLEKHQNHFVDLFFEKMLEHALPQGIPDREVLEGRITDPLRKKTDKLSVTTLVKNLRKLTAKLGGVFQTQYFFLKIFHWSQPSLTLSSLMLYTLTVLHPNIIFIFPLLFLLYGIMVPGYIYRHPIHRPKLHKTREKGDSLLAKVTRIEDDDKALEEFIEQARYEDDMIEHRVPELDDKVSTSYIVVQKNMEFFVNMRDVQNITTKLLKIWDDGEKFWYGTAGFKDERTSTSLFFSVFMAVIILVIMGPYIPWKFLLIVNGWFLMIAIHPKVRPQLMELKERLKPQKQELDKIVKESERKDIIIDETPDIREVEVFEIWRKSFTTNEWEFYLFSNQIFDHNNSYRKSQTPPPGVQTISEVACPKTWRFDDESWNIDYDCSEWCQNRGIRVGGETTIDANNEFLEDEQFKRRRLYRNVIRYSKPARKPAHLL